MEVASSQDKDLILQCLKLAEHGLGRVSPNPLVGCIITFENSVIASGYHQSFGGPHAEIEALNKLSGDVPDGATLYVNLEPCCHHGKTPPCTDAIISSGIKRVVVGSPDPFPQVNGRGIESLRAHGIEVTSGVCIEECNNLNRRFFTLQAEQRPYVILKWAETADGYMARNDGSSQWISSWESRRLTHRWRSYEDAIMVGTNTAIGDNPLLTVRHVSGRDPIRVLPDRRGRAPRDLHLFDKKVPTIVFSESEELQEENLEIVRIPWGQNALKEFLGFLGQRGVSSLIVEGGPTLLRSFLEQDYWDEARIFQSQISWGEGIRAPMTPSGSTKSLQSGEDTLQIIKRSGQVWIAKDNKGERNDL